MLKYHAILTQEKIPSFTSATNQKHFRNQRNLGETFRVIFLILFSIKKKK